MKRQWLDESQELWSSKERSAIINSLEILFALTKYDLRLILKLIKIQNRIWLDKTINRVEKINQLKGLRKHFIKLASSEPLIKIKTSIWRSSLRQDSDNNLINLAALQSRVVGNDDVCRAVLTVLWKSRDLNLVPTVDLESITAPGPSVESLDLISKEILEKWSTLGIKSDQQEYWYEDTIELTSKWSAKSGPNGHASCTSILEEASRSNESEALLSRIAEQYGGSLENVVPSTLSLKLKEQEFASHKTLFRRLSALADYEGKTRVIAIADYKTQTVLRPIHDRLMSMLKRMSMDLTYHHDNISKDVSKYWSKGIGFNPTSIDLTAATDRFPIEIICTILRRIWGSESLVSDWKQCMIGYDFATPVTGSGRYKVKYSVGQPMGLYSSWASFAISNHVIVRLAASRVNLSKFEDYMILGDDVVIFNEKVAQEYTCIMKLLGVSTKPQDSISPKNNHSLEIAKRLFRGGKEISPVPWRLEKTSKGLFVYHCMEVGLLNSLVSLYPGFARPMTAAALLYMWSRLPTWGPAYTFQSISDASNGSLWKDNHNISQNTIEQTHKVWVKWNTVESYKIFNVDPSKISRVNPKKVKRLMLKSLARRGVRTSLIARSHEVVTQYCEDVLKKAIQNSTVYRYINNMHSYQSKNAVIDVVELYDSYRSSLNDYRDWIAVDANMIILDKKETVDNQLILGIEKALLDLNYTEDQMTALYELTLSQCKNL